MTFHDDLCGLGRCTSCQILLHRLISSQGCFFLSLSSLTLTPVLLDFEMRFSSALENDGSQHWPGGMDWGWSHRTGDRCCNWSGDGHGIVGNWVASSLVERFQRGVTESIRVLLSYSVVISISGSYSSSNVSVEPFFLGLPSKIYFSVKTSLAGFVSFILNLSTTAKLWGDIWKYIWKENVVCGRNFQKIKETCFVIYDDFLKPLWFFWQLKKRIAFIIIHTLAFIFNSM